MIESGWHVIVWLVLIIAMGLTIAWMLGIIQFGVRVHREGEEPPPIPGADDPDVDALEFPMGIRGLIIAIMIMLVICYAFYYVFSGGQ